MKLILSLKIIITGFLLIFFQYTTAQNCTVNAGIDKTVCVGATVIQEGNIGGSYIGNPNTVLWTQVSGPGTATITSNTSLAPTISNLIAGTYVFQMQATCQVGGNAVDFVTINVITGATPVTHVNITVPGCYVPGTPIALTGTAPAGHSITWSVVSNSSPITPTFNGPVNGTYTGNNPTIQFAAPPVYHCNSGPDFATIKITSTNIATGCTTERTFSITYRYLPATVYAYVYPNPVCGNCTNLVGTCAQGGTGTWTVVSAPSGAPAVTWSPSNTSSNTRVCNLITGNYTFRWTVAGGACLTGFADVNVTVANGSPGTTTTPIANSQVYCPGSFPSTITLDGNAPATGETVIWAQVGGPPVTIINPNNPVAQATGLSAVGAPYQFSYRISSGNGCDKLDTMTVNVSAPLTSTVRSNEYCAANTTTYGLGADLRFPYMNSDSVTMTFVYESGPAASVNIFTQFTHFTSSFTVAGTVFWPNVTLSPGGSFTRTYPSSVLWPYTFPTTAYLHHSLNPVPGGPCPYLKLGRYNFRITVVDKCTTYALPPFSCNIGFNNLIANAGSDQVLPCGNTSTTLAGNLMVCNALPYWTTISRPGGSPNPINAGNMYNANAPLTGLQDGNYSFVWKAENGTASNCMPRPDTVRITVSTLPPAVPVITGGGSACINQPVPVSATISGNAASGTWTVTSVPAGGLYTITPSVNSPNINFIPRTAGTVYTLRWTVTNGCGSVFATTTITSTLTTAVVPDITNGNCQFQGAFGTLSATPTPAPVGTWNSSNPNYILATPNSTTTTVAPGGPQNHLGAVTFYYTLNNAATGGCGIIRDSVTFLPGYSSTTMSASNSCNISSFPAVVPITFTSLTPYLIYNLYVIGPGSPGLSTFQLSVPGTGYQTAIVNLLVNEPGEYRVGYSSVQWGDCSNTSSLRSILIQVSDPGPLAVAGPDVFLCGNNNTSNLSAQPNPLGTSNGRWGVQTVYSGAAPVFSATNIPNPTVTFSNGGGDVLLRWDVTGANVNCGGSTVDFLRIRYVPGANAGPDDYACYNTPETSMNMVLNANIASPGTGVWSILSQPSGSAASFINANLPNTTIINLIEGVYQLRWTVTDPLGNCPQTADTMNIVIIKNCNLLPVQLVTFNGLLISNQVDLSWEMKSEETGNRYILERGASSQGPYQSIGWVNYDQAKNGLYQFTDMNVDRLGFKNIYYRLKIVNPQLSDIKYSKILMVRTHQENNVLVMPTILNRGERIQLVITGNSSSAYMWDLVSLSGQRIANGKTLSGNTAWINTDKLVPGMYLLQVNNTEGARTFKILVQ